MPRSGFPLALLFLPSSFILLPSFGAEPLPAQATVSSFRLPRGFRASLVAAEPLVRQPIAFTTDDRGRIWVAENFSYPAWKPTGSDRIVILEDTDGDGAADKRTVFYDKLNYVTGLEVGFGGVWALSPPNLLFIPDRDGDDRPDAEPTRLLDGFGHQGVHNLASGLAWGPDGWLWSGHGGTSFGYVGHPDVPLPATRPFKDTPPLDTPSAPAVQPQSSKLQPRTAFDGGVWRYHPTRHLFDPVIEGTTNPWGLDFDALGQAFISNSVTPHLYHVIPGAHVERRRESPLSRHAYVRVPPAADHLHWVGRSWDQSRGGKADQLAAGGGHAHCGLHVYAGSQFPPEWRGRILMVNIHGARINADVPLPKGSGYSCGHGPDLLVSGDPWFRGLHIKAAPDGSLLVSDWYDTGECHTLKPDTARGRIYRISYGQPPATRPSSIDLAKLSSADLARLALDAEEWRARHARRLLHERAAAADKPDPAFHALLRDALTKRPDAPARLRALWSLYATNALDERSLLALLDDHAPWLRAWSVRLLTDAAAPSPDALARLVRLAKDDHSPVVRLHLASAAQRVPPANRWPLVEALASHAGDAMDANLPPMIWYALEPLVPLDPARALDLARRTPLTPLRPLIARRLAAGR